MSPYIDRRARTFQRAMQTWGKGSPAPPALIEAGELDNFKSVIIGRVMSNGIEVDCLVRRKSGGPMMLVLSVGIVEPENIPSARCAWYNGDHLECVDVLFDELTLRTIL